MKLDLSGKWHLSGAGFDCDALIPGDFYSALVDVNLMPEPYNGFNEQKFLPLNKADWTLQKSFQYKRIAGAESFLEITEADTIFTCFLNGIEAGKGKNQFARHRFCITDLLKDGENEIKFIFYSSENEAIKENSKLPYPIPCAKYDVYSPNRNLIRKCQCHSGWDWGPALMVAGIYGDIFIETTSTGLFDSLRLNFENNGSEWAVDAILEIDAVSEFEAKFKFEISSDDIKFESVSVFAEKNLQKGANKINAKITVKNPAVWKTSTELFEQGLSENPLYKITVSYEDEKCGEKSLCKKFAFNSLKCNSLKEDDGGRSLFFTNNGRRIFAKGTNWIPADALPSRCTDDVYKELLKSAAESNMNCVRVWGGGIYEKEIFYETCDRLGLIVWQDFMFACGLYPVTEDFLLNVENEIRYQIKRLQSHVCIGIWCGNNENFGTLTWFQESRENRDRYLVDYDRLYQGLISKVVKELDSKRLWWPSSPCAGPDDFADNWHSDSMGDMHYWSVWHEKKNFDAYLSINPRFVSEFGYQSFPSVDCIKTYCTEKDLNFTSPANEYHQRSPSGNALQLENFARYFRFPEGFENMVYLSQVQQALAIKTAVDWWRSQEPRCMGALVWQLNDVWPGPSWSSIEYGGKWKLLHYAQKDFFKPVHLSLFVKDEKIRIVICNDSSEKLCGDVTLLCFDFNGNEIYSQKIDFEAEGDSSKIAEEIEVESLCDKIGKKKNEFFIFAEFYGQTALPEKLNDCRNYYGDSTLFLDLFKCCEIQKSKIEIKVDETADGIFEITLKSDKPAFFVAIDEHKLNGRFDKNCFTLINGKPLKIIFTPHKNNACGEKITLQELRDTLTVKSLCDTY